ncbi:CheR family methyltransferase [Morganella morganii]|uniref:CheR family methyltransferase n=1 Tax=Morganella morganii TaxID=582 RepID=UPI0021D361BC|nr:CheR family methyltransferase [Morganella morganii]MCU6222913.1 chemotaxis protein-glutamate O-methyltransferase [Morganella morganii]MCU6233303.1 chemotaxis protein-glutamate O-methyltransferase [Morganella morganii]MCU6237616.1 chemotaxis protein-glutamate O-methyltransferase [Morganella morganii]MCU6275449.1 chemotaxis protein-glutamate O-methyltransferase [Morganella morganii]
MLNKNNVGVSSDPGEYIQLSLSESELTKINELIYRRAGIVLSGQKRDMVFNRLSRRLRKLDVRSFKEYIAILENSTNDGEWQHFINALTTNLTSFFREAYHFPILAEHARSRPNNYSVWCTAASTGEEPLSIAITLEETLGPSLTPPRVWATDIDTDVLLKAKQGLYQLRDIESLTPEQKKRWFLRGKNDQSQLVKVKKELASCIHYERLNLINSTWNVPAPFDSIFCRNVLIYFDQKTQETIINRFAKMLKPGGLLFIGHSEHFSKSTTPFRLKGQSVYVLDGEGK